MVTKVASVTKEVLIGDGLTTVLIGERINPSGRKKLSEALMIGDLEVVRKEALAQVEAGADILDVNVGVTGIDEAAMISQALETVMETVDVPLCIDSNKPKVIEAALKVYKGKPLINSVSGEERSFKEILPLVKESGAAVIGLTADDRGIPDNADQRLRIAGQIAEQAELAGIPREDLIIDCLAMTVGADGKAGLVTIDAIQKIKTELGVNMTLGASNISFGLPNRELLNGAFLSIVIASGINCPIVDAAKVLPLARACDLVLGRDKYAMRYTTAYRQFSSHH